MIKDSNEALKLKSLIIPQNLLEAAQILKTTGPDALLSKDYFIKFCNVITRSTEHRRKEQK